MIDCQEILRDQLTPERFVHSLAVADEAQRLAERYGADREKARIAGLLHDIMKDEPAAVQLQIIENSGIILSALERGSAKLLHAIAGALYVRDTLGVGDPAIFDAIRYHTTGRAGMSLLERVLFVADFTSRDRDYNGADTMRDLSNESLSAAIAEGTSFTMWELLRDFKPIHPDTVALYNEVVLSMPKHTLSR